jgi:fucose permease
VRCGWQLQAFRLCSFVVSGIAAAVFTKNTGYYVPTKLLSVVLCAVGSFMLSTLTPNSDSNQWISYQVIHGIGIGSGSQTSNLAPQNVLPRADVPLGMAMMFSMQQLGASVFVPVVQNIFQCQLVDRLSGFASLDTDAIVNTGATVLHSIVPASKLSTVVDGTPML